MKPPGKKKIVILGMMSKMPVAGVVWQYAHYLVGLERLGYEVYYVEAHGRTPSMFMETEQSDGSGRAAKFIAGIMERFGLAGRWAFHALHEDGRVYGLSDSQLATLYKEAALIINLHGGTLPLPEHYATGRLMFLETDPVEVQIQLYHGDQETVKFLEPHCAFFTFGECYGKPGCGLPVSQRFRFKPTRQPVVCDFWEPGENLHRPFTTIGNWQQQWREVRFKGQVYHWSKHFEFKKFITLPGKTRQTLELALSSYTPADQKMLEANGWRVRHGLDISTDIDPYRAYIRNSRAEFTVAKDQNVRLRSGWFSDRSATYLAAGRPVITQECGFSDIFPTGQGLFGFDTMEQIVAAIEKINADYPKASKAARALALDCFSSDVVLRPLLAEVGL